MEWSVFYSATNQWVELGDANCRRFMMSAFPSSQFP